ncbi:MAG TPA: DNA polymerase III subunit delta', partial [Phototrophicaceae bacterium]|nr:DNA polymerase III subunit delta' [Phototrophicaceae bacterium]
MTTHHWPVYGHDWAVEHLRKALANGRIRHAYLIVGTESVGKDALARAFAQTLNCTHPDEAARPCGECRSCKLIAAGSHPDIIYSELDAATGALRIEEVRNVTSKIALKPYEARYRIAIFRDFDHARPQAQDALLKTLEEPPPHALLILLAPATDALLPTIISRSQVITLRTVPVEKIRDVLMQSKGAERKQADLLARLSGGRIGWALRALEDTALLDQREAAVGLLEQLLTLNRAGRFEIAEDLSKDKLSLYPLLELWQVYWRDLVLITQGSSLTPANRDRANILEQLAGTMSPEEALAALEATRTLMQNLSLNLNLRLALEVLFLDYPGLHGR